MSKGKLSTVVELPIFLSKADGLLSSAERTELVDYLAKNPEDGDEIPRTGGLRKLRWGIKGKGKRGGARIIYYFYNYSAPVFLIFIYGKNQQDNLTPQEEKRLEKIASSIKEDCKNRRK